MIIVPWSFGCMPSLKLNLGFCATPSSRNGINCNLCFFDKSEKILSKEKGKRKDEVNALKKCSHINIVSYIDDFIDEKYSRIIIYF